MTRFWTRYNIATMTRYRSWRRISWLIVLGVCVASAALHSPTGAQSDAQVLMPPRAGLTEVHQPPLDTLEPEVRTQLIALQNTLAAQTTNAAVTTLQLSEAYGLMGQVYQAYALIAPAKACYWNARQLAPQDFRWTYLLAYVAQQEGQVAEALQYYTEARGLRPDYLAVPVHLGNLYLQLHRLAEATASFQAALALNAHCTAARYGLGQVALSKRHYGDAATYFEQALAEAPAATRIHYALAMAYRGMGRMQQAAAHLQQQGPVGVRVADPLIDDLHNLIHGERLHLLRGRIAFEAQRYTEAAEAFRKAVAAHPASVTARVNLGATLAQLGEVKDAIEQYQEVLRMSPSNAAAHYNLGVLLAREHQHAQAISHLHAVLQSNPQDTDARFLLARALVQSSRVEEALTEFSRVVETNPAHEEALLAAVQLLLGTKQYKQAIELLKKGNMLFPQQGRTAALLAYLLAASPEYAWRDGAQALALAKPVYHATGLVNHGAIVAMALAELGQCSEAAAWQRQMIAAAERDPHPAHNQKLVAKLKTELQRYESAQSCRPQGETLCGLTQTMADCR